VLAIVYAKATAPLVLRDHAQVAALFEGWDLIEPGVVQVPLWRPDGKPPRPRELAKISIYGGVGCKHAGTCDMRKVLDDPKPSL